MKRVYRRNLPHQIPENRPIFITWNLHGAIPAAVQERIRLERLELESRSKTPGESDGERHQRIAKQVFAKEDDFLGRAVDGPLHLKEPTVAKIVEDAILFGTPERYELLSWCVMANHVHVLLTPHRELAKVTQGIKGYTARKINELHQQTGRTFWQHESYDHWSRDDDETIRIIVYIENNPVAAGLCQNPEDWPWSSARFRKSWVAGEPFKT